MMTMPLNLPPYSVLLKTENGRDKIFDMLRRRYVTLTPEEWVRQHFVNFLIQRKGYPGGLMANEIELRVGKKKLRCDTVVYDKMLQPKMIVEYKAPEIALTQRVFDQITAYNMLLHVDYLVVSNGMQHYCCQMDYENRQYAFLSDIPAYTELSADSVSG